MPTARELSPTFDPLEPIHNPVTETPAPATEQPVVQYVSPEGTAEERTKAFLQKVLKDTTSNELREGARALLSEGNTGASVNIVKYHDEPKSEAPSGIPVEHAGSTPVAEEEKAPADKLHDAQNDPTSATSENAKAVAEEK